MRVKKKWNKKNTFSCERNLLVAFSLSFSLPPYLVFFSFRRSPGDASAEESLRVMAGPAATREGGGGGNRVAVSIANSNDEGGAAAADAAPTSTSTSPRFFLSRLLPRPPPARVLLSEASGAVGDLGTFLPLTLGLVAAVGLDFGTTLLFTGFYNIVSGFAFGVPMPVQPMKTIAAVAVASVSSSSSNNPPVTLAEVMAAGMFVSAVVLFLGLTRLVDLVNKIVPRSVVAGLQLGVGLKLAASGVKSVFLVTPAAAAGANKRAKAGWRAAGGTEGWALGATALVFLFVSTVAPRSKREEEERTLRSSSSSPALILPHRLQAALLVRKKRRKQRGGGGDESESNSSIGGSRSDASAELSSLPLASLLVLLLLRRRLPMLPILPLPLRREGKRAPSLLLLQLLPPQRGRSPRPCWSPPSASRSPSRLRPPPRSPRSASGPPGSPPPRRRRGTGFMESRGRGAWRSCR